MRFRPSLSAFGPLFPLALLALAASGDPDRVLAGPLAVHVPQPALRLARRRGSTRGRWRSAGFPRGSISCA